MEEVRRLKEKDLDQMLRAAELNHADLMEEQPNNPALRDSLWRARETIRLAKVGMIAEGKSITSFLRLEPELAIMWKVIHAARMASREIQAQKTMWPAEVDTLNDALKELDQFLSYKQKVER